LDVLVADQLSSVLLFRANRLLDHASVHNGGRPAAQLARCGATLRASSGTSSSIERIASVTLFAARPRPPPAGRILRQGGNGFVLQTDEGEQSFSPARIGPAARQGRPAGPPLNMKESQQ
jgi:hypothetical protein